MGNYKKDEEEITYEITFVKKFIWWLVSVVILVSIVGIFLNKINRTVETAIIKYEEFQELYNTCEKLNVDLCNIKDIPENDKMFEQFSKAQRINTIKTQLNRWVEDYNAKSKMWNRQMWKSNKLPYELNLNQFNCY